MGGLDYEIGLWHGFVLGMLASVVAWYLATHYQIVVR